MKRIKNMDDEKIIQFYEFFQRGLPSGSIVFPAIVLINIAAAP